MRFEVHHFHHYDDESGKALAAINSALHDIYQRLQIMSKQLDDLTADVAAEDTVVDSAVILLNGLSAALAAAGTDPVKLQTLADDITAKTAALSQAVAANTPAATDAGTGTTPAP